MFGEQRESHKMVLYLIHPSGVEEWYCPTCGQRFLLQWPPAHKKVSLELGNLFANQQGEKGGMDPDQAESAPTDLERSSIRNGPLSEEERRLIPWIQWLEQVDFGSRWGG